MPDKFMVIDRVELLEKDGKIVGRTLYDSDANSQNIKKGQGGKLEKRWDELDEGIGRAIKLTMGSFKPPGKDESYPFVADFEWVENVFEKEAIQRTAEGPSGQERGLWWKELGMRLQDDETLKGTAEWVRLRMNYYAQMFSVLNLKIGEEDDKETKPDKVSTEQVRQLPVEESAGDRKGIGEGLASREDLARLKEAMEIHGQDRESIIVIARALQFPEDSTKLTVRQVDKLIRVISPDEESDIEP